MLQTVEPTPDELFERLDRQNQEASELKAKLDAALQAVEMTRNEIKSRIKGSGPLTFATNVLPQTWEQA